MNEHQEPAAGARPPLTRALDGEELLRWYWTLQELTALARELDLPRGGGKLALTDRLAAALDGRPLPPPPPRRRSTTAAQLTAPVDGSTVIPEGQRCSQVLRAHFRQEIGPSFHFDAPMRAFIADNPGRTLADAVRHWHDTRTLAAEEPAPQFEFNRFLRDWHARNPDGTRAQAVAAWQTHRSRPKDAHPHRGGPDDH
ncbi:DUF6434 domain-containing protein [Kitasatospora camelliae]|uniref:DUF6434 domain-containing protein n=1 Tax=Kitasatospora camelliae TaxID=3156397 RepID=UPI003B586ADC